MTETSFPSPDQRCSLKDPTGWFAAGAGFRKALALLSDGAFRLFAYICLEADRRTGCLRATQRELATALGKSKRAIGTYIVELEAGGVCRVQPGKNQFEGTRFEVSDTYWPYHRIVAQATGSPEQESYVESVRACFLALDCGSGKFGAADVATARDLYRRTIPLALIEEAMLVGACRKYMSWFEGRALEPIQTLDYFNPLIAELQENPLPPGYSGYLRRKLKQFAKSWSESVKAAKSESVSMRQEPPQQVVQ